MRSAPRFSHMAYDLSWRIANWVRAELIVTGRTQAQLAEHLGIGQPAVSRRLRGKHPFLVDELTKIAEYFGVSVADVIDGRIADNSGHHSVSPAPSLPPRASQEAESDWTDPRPSTPLATEAAAS